MLKSIELNLHNICDLDCIMCDRKNFDKAVLPYSKVEEILNTFPSAMFVLTGGEPLLYPQIGDVLSRKNRFWLVTNGINAKKVQNSLLANAEVIRVSLDATDANIYKIIRGVDKFDAVINFIREIKSVKNDGIVATFTLQKENFTEKFINSALHLCAQLSIGARFYLVREREFLMPRRINLKTRLLSLVDSNLARTISEMSGCIPKIKTCFIAPYMMTIESDGDVVPCCIFSGVSRQSKEIVYGNILKDSLSSILATKSSKDLQLPLSLCKRTNCAVYYQLNTPLVKSIYHNELDL